MKKLASMLVVTGALWFSGLPAHAIPYSDYDDVLSWVTTTRSGTFDIVNGDGGFLDASGFNPTYETIISATASFTFLDIDGNANTVSADLGSNFFLSDTSNNNPSDPFIFLQASLTAESAPKSIAAVPDGGNTVSLLGLALLGLFGIERCWRKVKDGC